MGFNALASAAPDGYTLGAGPTTPIANAPYLMKGVRYNVNSFEYICHVFENAFTIAVAPSRNSSRSSELLDAAKANPGKLSYGHSGNGTIPAPFGREPGRCAGDQIPAGAVPRRKRAHAGAAQGRHRFRRSGGGDDQGARFPPARWYLPTRRHPALPDIPTVRELGVTTSVPPGQNGIFAPKGLPAEIKATLERACAEVVKDPAVLRAMANTGQTVHYLNGAEFHALTAADYKFKGELIHRLGLGAQ